MRTKRWLTPRLVGVAVISVVMLACQEERIISPEHIPPEQEKIPITRDIAWKVIHTDPNVQFHAIQFDPSGNFGMAYSVLDGRGYYTNNRGSTWRQFDLTKRVGLPANFSQVTIADTRTAWISARSTDYTQLFFGLTRDGGTTWIFKPFTGGLIRPWGVARPSADHIFVFGSDGEGRLLRSLWVSNDAGGSWNEKPMSAYVVGLAAPTPQIVVALVANERSPLANSAILVSSDGTSSWKTAYADTVWYFHTVHLATALDGIAVAARYKSDMHSNRLRQAFFRTNDGGNTWSLSFEFSIPWRGPYYSSRTGGHMIFSSPPTWLMGITYQFTGSGGINLDHYRSDDNGQTWAYLENLRGYYYAPTFSPPDWKIGIRGNQMTQDGGRTWQVKPWLITRAFFTSPYEVFAVKDSLILRGTAPQ